MVLHIPGICFLNDFHMIPNFTISFCFLPPRHHVTTLFLFFLFFFLALLGFAGPRERSSDVCPARHSAGPLRRERRPQA